MLDPVYKKIRYSELELELMSKLATAKKALETISDRDYESSAKPTYSGSSAYEYAESAYQQLQDCESYASNVANNLFENFDDEEYNVLSES